MYVVSLCMLNNNKNMLPCCQPVVGVDSTQPLMQGSMLRQVTAAVRWLHSSLQLQL